MRELGGALGEIPRPLGRAEREMRDAREALDNNQPGQAVPSQTRSLDQLQQGCQATPDPFMEMFSPGEGAGEGQVGARPGGAEERRGGEECVGEGRSRWEREMSQKKKQTQNS